MGLFTNYSDDTLSNIFDPGGFFAPPPKIPRADVPEEYRGGFGRGQAYAYEELASGRAAGAEQARLAEALRAQAEGRAPSLAAMQYARALEQSQAAAASQLASARGMSPAQAQRLLLTQQAAARAGAAGKTAELRLQEQQAAQAALANVLTQQRQQALLSGQVAGGLGAQAGELGQAAQRAEQERVMRELGIEMESQKSQKAGLATAAGTVLGAIYGGGAGATVGAKAGEAVGNKLAKGGEIKGRAKFNGDTRSNDTVPALLSPGEIVLPRTVAQAEDAPEKSKKFVEAIKSKKKDGKVSLATALARIQELESRLNAMEALADLEAEEQG